MEGAQADRDRMKTLLVEAISTLCRNGLQYSEELSVEGLIGITLDKKDVFLVSVKETFSTGLNKNGRDTPQSVDSPQSVSSRKASKRSGASSCDGPPEKHKRKGAPKQIPANEVELLNNSPSAHDVSLEDAAVSSAATFAGTGTYEPYDQTSQSSVDESEAIVIEEPDLPSIKTEIIKQENQNSCMYTPTSKRSQHNSAEKPTRPMPPLHPRPDHASPGKDDPKDPRSKHPAGVSPEEFAIYAQEVKQEGDADPDLSVFTSPTGEIIRIPRSMNSTTPAQPLPVNVTPGTSANSSMEGMPEFGVPAVDWGSPSTSQEFIPMPGGDDSMQESPSQQAPSSGASQQSEDIVAISAQGNGGARFVCRKCNRSYSMYANAVRHYRSAHQNIKHFCPLCHKLFKRRDFVKQHMRVIHKWCD